MKLKKHSWYYNWAKSSRTDGSRSWQDWTPNRCELTIAFCFTSLKGIIFGMCILWWIFSMGQIALWALTDFYPSLRHIFTLNVALGFLGWLILFYILADKVWDKLKPILCKPIDWE